MSDSDTFRHWTHCRSRLSGARPYFQCLDIKGCRGRPTARCDHPVHAADLTQCFASARILPRCALRRPVPYVNEGVHPRLDTGHPPLMATLRLPGLVGATGLHPFAVARSFSAAAFFTMTPPSPFAAPHCSLQPPVDAAPAASLRHRPPVIRGHPSAPATPTSPHRCCCCRPPPEALGGRGGHCRPPGATRGHPTASSDHLLPPVVSLDSHTPPHTALGRPRPHLSVDPCSSPFPTIGRLPILFPRALASRTTRSPAPPLLASCCLVFACCLSFSPSPASKSYKREVFFVPTYNKKSKTPAPFPILSIVQLVTATAARVAPEIICA